MKLADIRPGMLCEGPFDYGWCSHGISRIATDSWGVLWAYDTYWGSFGPDRRRALVSESYGELRLILDLNAARRVDREVFERYRDEDRAYIPVGGGSEEFWVRKGVAPDSQRVIQQLKQQIDDLRSDIAHKRARLAEKEALLLAQKGDE